MNFEHLQAAHCESGVVSSLLTNRGLAISEPMVFGLSSALAFAYIPLIKLAGQPLIAYRLPPKFIIKGLSKRLNIKMSYRTFKDPLQGAQALDDALEQGPVGLQTSVYFLPYFPEEMRFHFNGHNLIVYGRQDNNYQVSDPLFETPVVIDQRSLGKARFVRGPLAPKGLMYRVDSVPATIDYSKVVPAAIRKNCRIMLETPLPIAGLHGVKFLSKKIRHLKGDPHQQRLFLGHIVRMQEEIGTGGAGFRFIYASFLDEAATLLDDEGLREASDRMTETGDRWRQFALAIAQQCKNRNGNDEPVDKDALADALLQCAEGEEKVWRELKRWSKGR
jgi:hypothetical protein